MGPTLDQVTCARLPLAELAVLAPLRRDGGIRVLLTADRAWVRWESGDDPVLRRVVPVRGVELYAERDGLWYRPGHALPAFGIPSERSESWRALDRVLVPAPVEVVPPTGPRPRPAR